MELLLDLVVEMLRLVAMATFAVTATLAFAPPLRMMATATADNDLEREVKSAAS